MDILDPNVGTRCASSIIIETAYDAIANYTRCGGTANIFYYGYEALKELLYNRLGVGISKPAYFSVWDALRLFGASGDALKIRVPLSEEPTFYKVNVYAMKPEEGRLIVVKIEEPKED